MNKHINLIINLIININLTKKINLLKNIKFRTCKIKRKHKIKMRLWDWKVIRKKQITI